MKFRMPTATVLLAALILVASQASDVVTITTETISDVLSSNSFVMVEFYAPWCGHCKTLEPVWEQAATELKGQVVLAKVDATVETALAEQFGIRGFPTIKYFRDGELEGTYESGRSLDEIVKFAKAHRGAAVLRISNANEIEALKAEKEIVVVAYVAGGDLDAVVSAAANKLRAIATVVIAPVELKPATATSTVIVYKSFDEGEVFATPANTESVESFTSFISSESVKTFDEMGPHNYRQYLERGLPIAWLFVRPSDNGNERETFATIAPKYKGRISFIWVDAEKYGSISERLGLDGKSFPAFAIDIGQTAHYALPEGTELTAERVSAFADGVLDGTVSKTVRSEPTPDPSTEDGLTTVVGNTFDELVTKSKVDVLIEFYAPWCGHCKSFAPTYAAVAKALAGDTLRIAKLDGTANDFDQKRFPVRGFPTIFFVAVGKEPVEYKGDRDEASLTEFIKSHQTAAEAHDEL